MTLPVALSGTDVIGQAKTGTGKTLGFGLPLIDRVTVPADVEAGRARPEDLTEAPQALVVVPTRELCTQVTNDLLTAGKVRNVRVLAIYGGRAYEPQVEALKKGVDVVVGTPGRLLDLAGQKKLNLQHVRALVLDEADEMLDLGFLPDVEKIIKLLPARRQTMLFSATMPGAVIGLARRYMSQPTHIRATSPDDEGATVANTTQFVYRAHNMDKPELVARILQADGRGLVMVFCRTKRTAADLADQLKQRGFASGAVHGDLGQGAREQALRAFRNGKVDVLVCTDVAARGIDVEGVTHVINYQSPEEEKTYLHRIGRTGRAGAKGTAITLVDWDDIPRWQLINKALDLGFAAPPETYSTSPHLFSDLGIPEGTRGVLPRSERTRAGLDAEELEDLGEPGGRGPRGRGARGGGRTDSRPDSRSDERERSERTPRRRRRMRGGAPLDEAAPAGTAPVASPEKDAVAVSDEATAPRTPRRRRRMRGGVSAEQGPAAEPTATEPTAAAESAVATAESTPSDVAEVSEQPRRRRTRKSAATAEAVTPAGTDATDTEAAPAAGTAPAAEAPVGEATATRPRRRTRKAAASAETALDTAEGTTRAAPAEEPSEPKPRRTRKAAAVAEAAVDTAEGAEARPKTRRTRKAATAVQEPEAAEAGAEPRRRTRKTATAAPADAAAAAAEAAVDTAEGAEARPKTRRTRKAATAVQEPEAAEAGAEPRRRTRKTATAAPADAAAAAAEATEAGPKTRRTRKASEPAEAGPAVGIPAQSAQEPEAAAPRRRTRKATAAPAEADGGDPAEARPKARRTRKATASAEPADG
ncbi:DEAD/DEAH box helicase [Streptomyces sp. NPDC005925]|uniref:DEAD/DEAH box helicase n=1 Tax=Streptomyces sp. NPDC005925 TaxID=3157172 RepID=UPI00340C852D